MLSRSSSYMRFFFAVLAAFLLISTSAARDARAVPIEFIGGGSPGLITDQVESAGLLPPFFDATASVLWGSVEDPSAGERIDLTIAEAAGDSGSTGTLHLNTLGGTTLEGSSSATVSLRAKATSSVRSPSVTSWPAPRSSIPST